MRPSIVSALLFLLVAPISPGSAAAPKTAQIRHPEDLFVVDCLLPGKVRNLGRYAKFVAPRQVIRTAAHECGLRGGEYTIDPTRNDFALQSWLAQAEGGDGEAENNVGEIYEQGVRGTPDYAQAALWYRKAADHGSRRAQRNLAHAYESGQGVERDAVQAIVWYRKAAGLAGPADLDLEQEVAALRSEVGRLNDEATRASAELARNAQDLAAARAALAAVEHELADLKTRAAQPPKNEPAAKPAAEKAIAARQQEVEAGRKRVADLEAAQDRYRRLAAELEASAAAARDLAARGREAVIAKRAPAIEFFQPDVLATRGPALVPVPAGAREVEVVGKVTAELGLAEFTVAGERRDVGADGVFRLRFAVEPDRPIPFVAVDRAARRASAELVFVAPGGPRPTLPALAGTAVEAGRRYHALVLADAAYRSLPPLATAKSDGEELANLLRDRFGFEVTLVPDATFLAIMQRLTDLAARLGPQDDLLIYFAGHGRIDAGSGRGYWLPVDADPQDPSTWIPNEALARIFGTMRAGRVLVVADSCYAGTLAGLGLESAGEAGGATGTAQVRTVLSSGGLAPVLDEGGGGHSVFARALLTVLALAREPLSAARLYQSVAARVAYRSSQLGVAQHPEYAPIGFAGHEAGDFVFQPKG
ncbi:MAG: caspase family protein [Thermoanaerobaculia bacterium]